ncbi:Ribosomal large subunit pseudouridine synthase E, putative [Perkinsus marinus ATCC 50983]|uniref:Ribosomal large subunit pseudouridine synthase E, putative n=1 Tax=Perkinsus marinus (strain ATCC 50983 / TXsc) TaxID=423536 RepID=C5L1A5_PERM5|nr:Ribosomal large subunit pseudouridine synthase E, putative [Perkinsus marinus ATCC 50983]EER09512.1 Ribosomal large subunit pseudouridine synthase E, putative [Perkinsus marinus ATCC 50983]|eukprot:XP_002777696.1 Ribosomal large subunit pseudouridine synthase E, putative [Perkinsus marinus ATCC 50983]
MSFSISQLIAGRLDSDCSGLLVYTQDGRIAKAISDRYSSIPMEYEVALKAPCTDDQMSMLSQGMLIDGKQVEGCEAARINDNDDK